MFRPFPRLAGRRCRLRNSHQRLLPPGVTRPRGSKLLLADPPEFVDGAE